MSECLFCRIITGTVPSTIIYTDALCVAFEDITPKAPVHSLIVPRRHLPTLTAATETDRDLLGHLLLVARTVAEKKGIADRGFRVILNCNAEGGQTVFHVHLHLLGGQPLTWHPA